MTRRLVSSLLLIVLAFVVAGAVKDSSSLVSYPVLVTSSTFLLVAANVLPMLLRRPAQSATDVRARTGLSAARHWQFLRIIGFCLIWTAYVMLLNKLGFVLASSTALVASLWIMQGRFRPLASLSAVGFVLGLAILVTTVLFVPVPKAGVDHWIDETIYTLLEK